MLSFIREVSIKSIILPKVVISSIFDVILFINSFILSLNIVSKFKL